MRIGTKSLLFGSHQFIIHPLLVALAWWKIFGFPFDPRLWISFFVHDLGYWGKPNMDGIEGDKHVELGARIMLFFFGKDWSDFCLYHSRFYAKKNNTKVSKLCIADKFSLVLIFPRLYVLMASATGEIKEYMELARARTAMGEPKYLSMNVYSNEKRQWWANVREYLLRWVNEHKDGRDDTWTPKIGE